MIETRLYLPTYNLPSKRDLPVTLLLDPDSGRNHQNSQFGYYLDNEDSHIDTRAAMQEAGLEEITQYRDFGDDQFFGRYTLVPTYRWQGGSLILGYTLLGWSVIKATHPLIHQFSSGYVWKDYVLYLEDGTKVCTTFAAHSFCAEGGEGNFDEWIAHEKLAHITQHPVEILKQTRLDVLLWNTTNNQNFHTFTF